MIDVEELQKKYNELEKQNQKLNEELFNYKINIYLEKSSIPSYLIKDKNFMQLYDMPTYNELLEFKNKIKNIEHILQQILQEEDIDKVELKNGDILKRLSDNCFYKVVINGNCIQLFNTEDNTYIDKTIAEEEYELIGHDEVQEYENE